MSDVDLTIVGMPTKRSRTAAVPRVYDRTRVYDRMMSCVGLCSLVTDCLMDDELTAWLRTNRDTRDVVYGSGLVWWTRYKRQYEC
jgi:hypothetical protein